MHALLSSTALCSALLIVGNGGLWPQHTAGPQGDPVNFDAKTMAEFTQAVEEYAALHRAVEAGLPKLSDSATPQEIDRHQREFGTRLAKARAGARQGDLFSPSMQAVARRLMERLFRNAESRRQLRESVMDDNPSPSQMRLAVNARYPDAVPLSTMPPDVLKNLPPIPKEVEYRFVGATLILLDPDAHVVADFVPNVLPK
jgi:hypothetical protein